MQCIGQSGVHALILKAKAVMAEKQSYEASPSLSHRVAARADKIKYIVIALVVIVAAGIGIFTYQRQQSEAKEARAENALYQAEIDILNAPETDAAGMFGKMAQEFRGMPAGARALVMQFGHAFNTGDFAVAEKAARDFLAQYPSNILAERAALSLGQALLEQNRLQPAIDELRKLTNTATPEMLPEAKLALAQALEKYAEEAKDNPDEYRSRLAAAEAEYNDIIVRSQISAPSQRGFWPQAVTVPADFSLVVIKDKLSGHVHESPVKMSDAPLSQAERDSAALIAAPVDADAEAEQPEE